MAAFRAISFRWSGVNLPPFKPLTLSNVVHCSVISGGVHA